MNTHTGSLSPLRWVVAFAAGFAVFLFVNVTTSLVAFIIPKTFASSTRILLMMDSQSRTNGTAAAALAAQIELMKSDLVLGSVATELGLAAAGGKQSLDGESTRSSDPIRFLRERLDIRPIRNTAMIEVRAFHESSLEAARIANQVASAYRSAFPTNGAQIAEKATLGRQPVRPNKPLIIGLGALGGYLLGGIVAAGVILLGVAHRR